MIFLLLVVLGILAGVLAGFFGIGGGVLFTPIFFLIFSASGMENPVPWTIGTSLFCTFIAAVSSSFQQLRQHNLYLGQGMKVGILGAVGVYLGKLIVMSSYYTEVIFVIFFASLLLVVAVLFYRRGSGKVVIDDNPDKIGWNKSVLTGGIGGLVAALAGIGGGSVMVPIMNLWYRIGLTRAVSVSSLAIVVISLSGWLQFAFFADGIDSLTAFTVGTVDFGTAFPVIIGAFAGGIAGARLNEKVNDKSVQIGFSLLVLAVAAIMIYGVI